MTDQTAVLLAAEHVIETELADLLATLEPIARDYRDEIEERVIELEIKLVYLEARMEAIERDT